MRAVCDPDNERAEFAIIVASTFKGRGLGRALLEKMIRYAERRGTGVLVGEVLRGNQPMLGLAKRLGFRVTGAQAGEAVGLELDLGRGATP
jgi:acetyltransferase